MRRMLFLMIVGLANVFAVTFDAAGQRREGNEIVCKFDDGAAPGWTPIHGTWIVKDGRYEQTDFEGPSKRRTFLHFAFREGVIEFDATVLRKNNANGSFGSFGVIWKHSAGGNFSWARFGAYKMADVYTRINDEPAGEIRLGAFQPKIGRTYHIEIVVKRGAVIVAVDGMVRAVARDLLAGKSGRVGLLTESHTAFDNVKVTRFTKSSPPRRGQPKSTVMRQEPPKPRETPAPAAVPGRPHVEGFDVEPDWVRMSGSWKFDDGVCGIDEKKRSRRFILAPVWVRHGVVSAKVKALAVPRPGLESFGLYVKYTGAKHHVRVVAVDGELQLVAEWPGAGRPQIIGPFNPVKGKWYRLECNLDGKRVAVQVDGKQIGSAMLPSTEPGRIGLVTMASAQFDDVTVRTPFRRPGAMPPLSGTPAYALEFVCYRPDVSPPSSGMEMFPTQGTAYVYVRNIGDGAAVLDRILLDGVPTQKLIASARIGWHLQKPYWIAPGEIGEITIRMESMTRAQAERMLDNPHVAISSSCRLVPARGKPVDVKIPVTRQLDPLQINFIGFSEDLHMIYVYVQRNGKDEQRAFEIAKVSLDGRDVTAQTAFGSRTVTDTVLPLEIRLDEPLVEGKECVVTIMTVSGERLGHAVRAVPSYVPLNVSMFHQERKDALTDIYQHGANSLLRLVIPPSLRDVRKAGFETFIQMMGASSRGGWVRDTLEQTDPGFPRFIATWIDEVDKDTVSECAEGREHLVRFFAKDGTSWPLQLHNVMRPWTSGGKSFLGLTDGSTHAYGLEGSGGGANGDDFPLLKTLQWREYRTTRRLFWPYLRCGEISLFVDPLKKSTMGANPNTRRVIDPREQRLLMYGLVQLGAKGFMHWFHGHEFGEKHLYYTDGMQIRVSLGALDYPRTQVIHGIRIGKKYAESLHAAWDEIARIHAELQTIAPWLACSDVDPTRARIVKSRPRKSPRGGPAAQAVALPSGLDTILLVVLNLNMDSPFQWGDARGVTSYDPVNVETTLRKPAWVKDADVFSVDIYDGIKDVAFEETGGDMRFRLPKLEAQKIIVVTSRLKGGTVRARMRKTLDAMRRRLGKLAERPAG